MLSALAELLRNYCMILREISDRLSDDEYERLGGLYSPAKSEYEQLQKSAAFLEALEAVGVDNWNGYSDAYALIEGE